MAELRSAIAGASDSLQELEASDLGISLSDLGLEGDSLTDLVIFAVSDPFQLVLAGSGPVTDSDRIWLESELAADSLLEQLTQGIGRQLGGEIHGSGALPAPDVGDASLGVYLEMFVDEIPLRVEMIMFRRGDLFGAVYSYSDPETQPTVTIEELAAALDKKMIDVIGAREP